MAYPGRKATFSARRMLGKLVSFAILISKKKAEKEISTAFSLYQYCHGGIYTISTNFQGCDVNGFTNENFNRRRNKYEQSIFGYQEKLLSNL